MTRSQLSRLRSFHTRDRVGRTCLSSFSHRPMVKLLTPMCLVLPCSTSFSMAAQVGDTSLVKAQSISGLPLDGCLANATGQLRVVGGVRGVVLARERDGEARDSERRTATGRGRGGRARGCRASPAGPQRPCRASETCSTAARGTCEQRESTRAGKTGTGAPCL